MSLVDHARFELRKQLALPDEDPDRWMAEDVIELIEAFARQGHSGFSAPYCIEMFRTLASWKPLGPLTGEDDEWTEVADGVFQNRRCSHVFKEGGQAYDSQGRIFEEPDGSRWQNGESRVAITFPYTPTTEIVMRPSEEACEGEKANG